MSFLISGFSNGIENEKKHYYSCKSQTCVFHMWSNSFFPLNPKCGCTEQQVKNTDEVFRMQNLQSPAGSINNF
jgi:hypothetical protein